MEAGRFQTGWARWSHQILQGLASPRLLAVIVVVGVAARFSHYLAGLSYWYDEAFLLVPVYERSWLDLLGPLPTQTIIPPLFLWLLKGIYLLAGPGELAMRLPAFLAGLLGLVLLLPAALRLNGRPGGYWVVALGALSHHSLMHGSEVRGYTFDFLATVLILGTAAAYLQGQSPKDGRLAGGGLLLLSLVAPWVSFTSVLVFGAVSLALVVDLAERGGRARWAWWAALNGALGVSVFAVWYVQARHLYYPGLVEHWRNGWDGFPADNAPATVAAWSLRRFVGLGHYASTGLGVPLLLLGLWGVAATWRESRPRAVLLAGPVVTTYVAALATKYPFSDRTIFFLAPCVWCLAMKGLTDLWQRLPQRWGWPVPVLLTLLGVSLAKVARDGAAPASRGEFREALCYVNRHRAPGDEALVCCRYLNQVYFGHVFPGRENPCLEDGLPWEALAGRVRDRRLWIVAPDILMDGVAGPFRRLPLVEGQRRHFYKVHVLRLDPPGLGPERLAARAAGRDG